MKPDYLFFPLCLFLFIIAFTFCNTPSNSDASVTAISESKSISKDKPYTSSPAMVRAIFEDSKGRYWIGRDKLGLTKYDGVFPTHYTMKDGLSDNQIRRIQEDQKGNIWLETGNGLTKYDGEKFTINTSKNYNSSADTVNSEWQKDPNDLWFNGELQGGVYRYDGENLSVLKFPVLGADHPSFSIKGTITDISYGKNNMLWLANYGGVLGFDGVSFKYINQKGINYHVRAIFEDSKGNLWIGNNGIGVLFYDGKTSINFTEAKGLNFKGDQSDETHSHERTFNRVFAIAEDREGNIWFGDRDTGAWRYDGKSMINYTLADGLTNTLVRTIYKDKSGDLWFGLGDGSVFKFNGKGFDRIY